MSLPVVGNSCLEKEVRDMLKAISAKDPTFVASFIENLIPDCVAAPAAAVKAAATRAMPTPWGAKVTYIDAKGVEREFDSPSAVLKALGISTSGIQCDLSGKSCRSTSQIESLTIKGFTVWGNGEGTNPVKGVSKHLTVIHPEYVASMAAERQASKRMRAGEVKTRKATAEELANLKG